MQPPRDWHEHGAGDVQRLDGVRGHGVQDVRLVDAVGAHREGDERHDAEGAGGRPLERGAEHLGRRSLALPVGVQHDRGRGHRGRDCFPAVSKR